MTCFKPLKAFRTDAINPDTGKRGLTFNPLHAVNSALPLKLPCGQCDGCRHDKAASWAVRLGHEAKTHDRSSFVTLTYSDEAVPSDYSVKLRDWQLFMKRLRKQAGTALRFFGCGEYGDRGGRPHYHGLIFGEDFANDRTPWAKRNGHQTYKSEALQSLWPHGHVELGSVTPSSAGYVARYCLKKMTGPIADDHYFRLSPIDGQMHRVEPEFATMSRRPGIGTHWFRRFAGDAFPSDFIIVDGRRRPVPSYYLRKLEAEEPELAPRAGHFLRDQSAPVSVQILRRRKAKAADPRKKADATPERLAVREEVHRRKVQRLVRTL